MKIIDAHSHCIPLAVAQNTTFFKQFWSDADTQLKVMDAHGIEKSVLLYPTSDAHLKMGGWTHVCQMYNADLAKIVAKAPDRFVGAGILPFDDASALTEELKKISDYGFKVVSLASSYDGRYIDDERFFALYEVAQRNRWVIHVHPQIMNPIGEDRVRDPLLSPVLEYVFDVSMAIGKLMMSGVFLKYPDVKFIFAHYGGVLPIIKERFDNTYLMLRKREYVKDLQKLPSEYFKKLFFDTSGSKSLASLMCALELVSPAQLLWGSDYPANQSISEAIAVVNNAELSTENKNLILRDNLLSLLSF